MSWQVYIQRSEMSREQTQHPAQKHRQTEAAHRDNRQHAIIQRRGGVLASKPLPGYQV